MQNKFPEKVTICEVVTRDGFQTAPEIYPVEEKVRIIEEVVDAGCRCVEVGAFSTYETMYKMKDTDKVFEQLHMKEGVEYRGLVYLPDDVRRAAACGCRKIKLNVSASNAHNQAGAGRSPLESLRTFAESGKIAEENGMGFALVILGYTTTATFHTIINWITIYASDVAGMSETAASSVMSFYSTGAVIAVAVTAVLVQKAVKSVRLLILYPTLATIAITVLLMFPSDMICRVCGFLIGCFAGGGVLQLAAAVIVEFFPDNKGTVTGMVFTASGVAMFAGPNITGWLSGMSVSYVLVYDIVVTLIGVCLAILVNIRYNQVVCPKRK